MKKFNKFKDEIARIAEKTEGLRQDLAQKQYDLSEKQRLIHDLNIQKELEEHRAADIDKLLTKANREEAKLQEEVKALETRISSMTEARIRRLESFRDEAHAEVVKDTEKLTGDYAAKLRELHNARGVIIELLLGLHQTRKAATTLVQDFVNHSGQLDDKHAKMKNPIPYYSAKALLDNYQGEHAPVLPSEGEMQRALDGSVPNWFDYWKLTGDICSPAEIAAKAAKK